MIRDNDNPFGVISFTAQSLKPSINEVQNHITLQIVRTGGVFSRATILVQTIGGGEVWQDGIINSLPSSSDLRQALNARTQPASAVTPNQDYIPVQKTVVFEVLMQLYQPFYTSFIHHLYALFIHHLYTLFMHQLVISEESHLKIFAFYLIINASTLHFLNV